jgi:ATP-dependent helicase/nuclease subunit A
MAAPRNLVVFAPAGSGKTKRLVDRYIELLDAGVPPERILALTFTEKAAAEMKERVLRRLDELDPKRGHEMRLNALKLRISTIHAFCLTLVRRFAPSLGLDPRVEVLTNAGEMWTAAKYDTLMAIAESKGDREAFNLLLELVTRGDRSGWAKLSELFDGFFESRVNIVRGQVTPVDRKRLGRLAERLRKDPLTSRLADVGVVLPRAFDPAAVRAALEALEPQADTFLTKSGTPRKPRGKGKEDELEWNERCAEYYDLLRTDNYTAEFARSFELFRQRFLDAYNRRKRESGQVDYDDMEYFALQLLQTDPDWQNVLRAFDEHTDHLLVDEFQDTSFLQWGIIDKLTEEWRSGEGAKADRGVEPTVFIVGDEKQSIYMFRDAKVEVFGTAADKLEQWLGPGKLDRRTLEDNYRSLQSIIDFNNRLFSSLMAPPGAAVPPWQTRYAPFRRARQNEAPGTVEVILAPGAENTGEGRDLTARAIARRIGGLLDPADPFPVYDRQGDGEETRRACRYGDIGILFRTRSSLPAIEAALREAGIPFLVSGGTGFYDEPEVRYLVALTAALVDPFDSLALYATLSGPVFDIPERDIFLASSGDAPSLLDRCRASAQAGSAMAEAVAALDRARALVPVRPLARILESTLAERAVWKTFWEPQRLANLRKLLALIEDRQAGGESPLRILRGLQDASHDEAKADVRPEGRDAVQLMTVHGAKGLQFPVVFLAGLDGGIRPLNRSSGEELVIEETSAGEVRVSWLPEAGLRRADEFHSSYVKKEVEEEKRILYVACTRARDGLFLAGALHKRSLTNTWLAWLAEHLGLVPGEFRFEPDLGIPGVTCINAEAIPEPGARPQAKPAARKHLKARPAIATPPPRVQPISRNIEFDRAREGHDDIGLGDAVHRLLELLSLGKVAPAEVDAALSTIDNRHSTIVVPANLTSAITNLASDIVPGVLKHVQRLIADKAAWSIIAPRKDAETELPVMYSDGETVWTGRIDRVIFDVDEIRIYDYKTFTVPDDKLDAVAQEYHDQQLFHYAAALKRMYPEREVSTWLVFTGLRPPRIVRTS